MYKECYAQVQGTLCTRNVMYKKCYVQATLKCLPLTRGYTHH